MCWFLFPEEWVQFDTVNTKSNLAFSGGIFILWQDNGEVSTHFFHIVFGLGSLQYGMVVAVVPEHGLNGMHELTNSPSTSAACSVLYPAVCLLRCYIARGKESMHSDTCRAVELSTFCDLWSYSATAIRGVVCLKSLCAHSDLFKSQKSTRHAEVYIQSFRDSSLIQSHMTADCSSHQEGHFKGQARCRCIFRYHWT